MTLPAALQAYFDADAAADDTVPLGAFAPDATIRDEGKTHVGHGAIAAWWRAAKAQYRHTAKPLEAREDGSRTLVRARVTGAFPGSPADLTFAFRLEGGLIGALEIRA